MENVTTDLDYYLTLMDDDEYEIVCEYYAEELKNVKYFHLKEKYRQAPYITTIIYSSDRECYPDKRIEELRKEIRDKLAVMCIPDGIWPFGEDDNFEWTKEYK